ncbi:MAG: hypothetical protein AB7V43_10235 [Acidimicrobiia bacterium]
MTRTHTPVPTVTAEKLGVHWAIFAEGRFVRWARWSSPRDVLAVVRAWSTYLHL